MTFLLIAVAVYLGIGFMMMIMVRIEDGKTYKELFENQYQTWGNLIDHDSFKPRLDWMLIPLGVPALLLQLLEK